MTHSIVLPEPHLSETLDPMDFEIAARDFLSAGIPASASRRPVAAASPWLRNFDSWQEG